MLLPVLIIIVVWWTTVPTPKLLTLHSSSFSFLEPPDRISQFTLQLSLVIGYKRHQSSFDCFKGLYEFMFGLSKPTNPPSILFLTCWLEPCFVWICHKGLRVAREPQCVMLLGMCWTGMFFCYVAIPGSA